MIQGRATRKRAGAAMAVLAFMAMIVSACTPPPAPADVLEFDSAASGKIHIDIFVAGDPAADPPTEDSTIPVDINLTGQVSGTWSNAESGPFAVDLAVDGGSFALTVPDLPVLTVTYAVDPATGSGHFDAKTGVGSFDTTLQVTVESVDLLGPIAAPCQLGLDMSLAGKISPSTGRLTVIQDGFTVIPPADADCGGLGAIFGGLLGNPLNSNTATMGFNVGTFTN